MFVATHHTGETARRACGSRRAPRSRARTTTHSVPLRPLGTIEWLALFAAALALAIALASSMMGAQAPDVVRWEQHTVTAGSTLWSIAEACQAPGRSVAETVALIRDQNELGSGVLQAGQRVSVPVITADDAAVASRDGS